MRVEQAVCLWISQWVAAVAAAAAAGAKALLLGALLPAVKVARPSSSSRMCRPLSVMLVLLWLHWMCEEEGGSLFGRLQAVCNDAQYLRTVHDVE